MKLVLLVSKALPVIWPTKAILNHNYARTEEQSKNYIELD